MFRTILMPVEDGIHGEVAEAHLWKLAALYRSRAYIVRIVDVSILEEGTYETEEARRLLERDAKNHLASMEEKCKAREVTYKSELIIGETVEELVQCAQRADLIIMGESLSVRGDEYEDRKAVVRDVFYRIHRPMLIARDGGEALRRIQVGYDGSEKGGHALQLAADLSERSAATLSVVVAADTRMEGVRLIDEATAYLEAYRLSWNPVLFEGTPSEALARTAEKEEVDLTVIGSHGHGRLHELTFGSTTGHVLQYVRSSILIYR